MNEIASQPSTSTCSRQRRIVILLENLPVERDRRVWRQAQALVRAGMAVTVICPDAPGGRRGLRRPRTVNGIEIRTFRPAAERGGILGFVWEYLVAGWQMTRALGRCRRAHGIDGIQACNPPDIFFPIGWWARRCGVPFVFDQHDLSPELYATRFDVGSRTERHVVINRLILALLLRCERETYLAATRVIATNNSYRRIAIERGGLPPDDVVVVRNGPDPDTMYRRSLPSVARPDEHLVVWMGNMGPQDGVDDAIRAVSHLVHEIGRTDARFLFIGRGEVADEVRALSHRLELDDYVTFTGWIPDEEAFDLLSLADVGLSADPPGPLNDKSTMIKTLEYMAFGLPIVAHDLHESRVSAGPAAVYANSGDARGLARCLDRLLSEPDRMAWMGNEGRLRIERGLSWPHQARAYVELWSSITGHLRDTPGESSGESVVVSIDPAWSDSADRSPVERQEVKL